MTLFFTSDTHFGHKNILQKGYRPFVDVEAMHAAIIANWNAVVPPDAAVWHLGDFAYKHPQGSLAAIFAALNGEKHLLIGNHDNAEVLALPWASQQHIKDLHVQVADQKRHIVLCHYPIRSWNRKRHGSVHIHGHAHGEDNGYDPRAVDAGVDCWEYRPVALDTLLARLG